MIMFVYIFISQPTGGVKSFVFQALPFVSYGKSLVKMTESKLAFVVCVVFPLVWLIKLENSVAYGELVIMISTNDVVYCVYKSFYNLLNKPRGNLFLWKNIKSGGFQVLFTSQESMLTKYCNVCLNQWIYQTD